MGNNQPHWIRWIRRRLSCIVLRILSHYIFSTMMSNVFSFVSCRKMHPMFNQSSHSKHDLHNLKVFTSLSRVVVLVNQFLSSQRCEASPLALYLRLLRRQFLYCQKQKQPTKSTSCYKTAHAICSAEVLANAVLIPNIDHEKAKEVKLSLS